MNSRVSIIKTVCNNDFNGIENPIVSLRMKLCFQKNHIKRWNIEKTWRRFLWRVSSLYYGHLMLILCFFHLFDFVAVLNFYSVGARAVWKLRTFTSIRMFRLLYAKKYVILLLSTANFWIGKFFINWFYLTYDSEYWTHSWQKVQYCVLCLEFLSTYVVD